MSEELKELFSEQFQRVNKQEKHLSSERQKLEEMKRELEETRQDATKFRSLKGKNPFEILESFGITYEKLLEADKEKRTPMDPYMKKLMKEQEELRSLILEERQAKEAAELERRNAQLMESIKETAKSKEFDIIDKLDLYDKVREHMAIEYKEKGEVPSYEDACKAVTKAEVKRFNSIKDSKWLSSLELDENINPELSNEPKNKPTSNKSEPKQTTQPNSKLDEMTAAFNALKAKKESTSEHKSVVQTEPTKANDIESLKERINSTSSKHDKLRAIADAMAAQS